MNFTNMPQMKLPNIVLPPDVPQPIPNIEIVLKPDTDPAVLLPQPIVQHHHHHGPISQGNLDINNNEVTSTSDILPYTSLSLNKQRTYIEIEVLGQLEKSQKAKPNNTGSVVSNISQSLLEDDFSSSSHSDLDDSSSMNSPNMGSNKSIQQDSIIANEYEKQIVEPKIQPTLKRRRGRPRKHPIPNSTTIADISITTRSITSSPPIEQSPSLNNGSSNSEENSSFTNKIVTQNSFPKSADKFKQGSSHNGVVKRKRGRPKLPPLEERQKSKYVKKSSKKIDLGRMIIQQFP